MLHCVGWLEAGLTMSYEKFVMDLDQCGAFHTLARSIALDENGFALDALREVGPGKHHLGSTHTLANYQTAFYDFPLSDNNSFEQWSAEGSKDQLVRANARWKELLAGYEQPPLDVAKDEAIREYIERKRSSMPDAAE
jgi:trimethylamine--corrinoid protein Co-methyltransferase